MSLIADYSEKLAASISAVGSAEFVPCLIDLLGTLVPFDDATIIVYPAKRLPIIDYFQPLADGTSHLDKFINAAFLFDPYYIAATKTQLRGFFHMKDISPDSFRESEYYLSFYSDSGYQDECGYIVATGDGSFVQVSLARTQAPVLFSSKQLDVLSDTAPVIEQLCQQHWKNHDLQSGSEQNLRVQLHTALEEFGSSLLSERQMQVINFLLHGYSTKMVAEKLGISIETVKLHRKHAYAKLAVGSQGELFHLFLDSLMSAKNYTAGDTLSAYLKPPE